MDSERKNKVPCIYDLTVSDLMFYVIAGRLLMVGLLRNVTHNLPPRYSTFLRLGVGSSTHHIVLAILVSTHRGCLPFPPSQLSGNTVQVKNELTTTQLNPPSWYIATGSLLFRVSKGLTDSGGGNLGFAVHPLDLDARTVQVLVPMSMHNPGLRQGI